MITPELNQYITFLEGKEYKGLIFLLYGLGALFIRPFSGKLADTIGRVPVMVIGSTIGILSGFFYPIFITLSAFLFIRFFHGFASGFKPIGTTAYLSDLIPFTHRGQAMGYLGMAGSSGMAIGPFLGSYLATNFSLNTLFLTSSLLSAVSLITVLGMKESLKNKQKFTLSLLKISWKNIYTPTVWLPSSIMFLSIFSFGTILVVIPDLHDKLGIENRGSFMLYMVFASIFSRYFAGKISDVYGRVFALKIGLFVLTIGMIMTGLAQSYFWLMFSGVICGISVGINSPTIFAWTIDLADENEKGPAISTMLSALEIGVIISSLVTGLVYHNDLEMIPFTFWIAGFVSFLGLVLLYAVKEK